MGQSKGGTRAATTTGKDIRVPGLFMTIATVELRRRLAGMSYEKTILKLKDAAYLDSALLTPKAKAGETFGHNPAYLETLGLTKSDLIRLSRLGFALKARYATKNKKRPHLTGPHRTRWILFSEVLDVATPTMQDL
jgi:hypothetical protein